MRDTFPIYKHVCTAVILITIMTMLIIKPFRIKGAKSIIITGRYMVPNNGAKLSWGGGVPCPGVPKFGI